MFFIALFAVFIQNRITTLPPMDSHLPPVCLVDENDPDPIDYETEIAPIFQAKCADCHGEKPLPPCAKIPGVGAYFEATERPQKPVSTSATVFQLRMKLRPAMAGT